MGLGGAVLEFGATVVRGHCVFRWYEAGGDRAFLVEPRHCDACVAELRASWPDARLLDAAGRDVPALVRLRREQSSVLRPSPRELLAALDRARRAADDAHAPSALVAALEQAVERLRARGEDAVALASAALDEWRAWCIIEEERVAT